MWFLMAVEAISRAEHAKRTWNPKDPRTRKFYEALAADALAAARLAVALDRRMAWDPIQAPSPLRDLVDRLVCFVFETIRASWESETARLVSLAGSMLAHFFERHSKVPLSNQLIAELVWLAGGKSTRQELDEATIRRYREAGRRQYKRLQGVATAVENDEWDRIDALMRDTWPGVRVTLTPAARYFKRHAPLLRAVAKLRSADSCREFQSQLRVLNAEAARRRFGVPEPAGAQRRRRVRRSR
jgi:hypothetical protein